MRIYLRLLVFLLLVSLLAFSFTGCGGDVDAQILIDGDDPDVVIVICDTNLLVSGSSPSDFLRNELGAPCAEVIEDLIEVQGLRIEAVTALEGSGIVYTLVDLDFP